MRCSATLHNYFFRNLMRSAWDSLSDNLLKAIAKTIERYETEELPRSTTTHDFHHDDDDEQQTTKNLFLPGIIIWDDEIGNMEGRDWKHNSPRELATTI